MGKYQPFRDLDAETNDALRKSIARFGVVCPVIVDANGSIIDGHQRARIAGELGLTYPTIKRAVRSADDAIALAYSLNADRRMLTVEQRREIVADLREQGYSLRAIAGVTNASIGTVHNDVKQSGVQVEHVTGDDGRTYPASRPANVDEHGEIVGGGDGRNDSTPPGQDESPKNADPAHSTSEGESQVPPVDAPSDSPSVPPTESTDPEAGYRERASRVHATTRSSLLALDPERIALVTEPKDRGAWRAFASDLTSWAASLTTALDEGSHLRRVK